MITRREFMRRAGVLGAAGSFGPASAAFASEPPPETKRIRLAQIGGICIAPQYVAETILPGEGFSDVQYVKEAGAADIYPRLAAGDVDISMAFIAPLVAQVDKGVPIVMLAGVHPGCFEIFTTNGIRTITELKGKRISIPEPNSSHHLFISTILSHVGLDPQRDVKWVVEPFAESMRSFAAGKVEALIAFPPVPQELRAKKIGKMILSSVTDKPWSQYFCCVIGGNRDFVKKNPVATKRAVRGLLKGNHVCASEPEATAKFLVQRGFTANYEYALQTLKELPYARWRDFNAEDSIRFFALRLQEGGYIKSSPKTIIAKGTDWRFMNELKKELKA